MKIKKIFSALLAVGMVMSSLATSAYAYENDAPNLIVTASEEYAEVEGNEVYDYFAAMEMDPAEELGEGYTAYLLYFRLADITLGRKTSGSTANQRLTLLNMFYEISGTAKADAIFDTTYYDGQIGDPDSNIFVGPQYDNALLKACVGTATVFYPTAGTNIVEYTEEEPTEPILVLLVKIKKGTQLVLTPLAKAYSQDGLNTFIDNSYVQTKTYSGKNETGDIQYLYGASEGTVLKTNTITLGEASAPVDPEPEEPEEPEDPTPATPVITGTTTSTDVTVTDDNKGKVWNGIKIKDVPKGKNYQVKFTDSTVGAAEPSKTFDLNLNGKEVNGDIDFAVVLKTTKNLANITMEILYELVNAQ